MVFNKTQNFYLGGSIKKYLFSFLIMNLIIIFLSCNNKKNENQKTININKIDSGKDEGIEEIETKESDKSKNEEQKKISDDIKQIAKKWEKDYLPNWYWRKTSLATAYGRSTVSILDNLEAAKEAIKKDKPQFAKSLLKKVKKTLDKEPKPRLPLLIFDEIIGKIDQYNDKYKYKFECQARNFVNFLYDYSNNLIFFDTRGKPETKNIKRSTNCFLRGVFIFEDKDGKIFNILAGDKPKKCSNYIAIRTTHSSVIKKVQNNKETKIKLYNFEGNSWDNPSKWRGLTFYETAFNKPIKLSCQTFDKDGEKKLVSINKGVAVIARFKVIKKDTKEEREYTFFKPEPHEAISVAHVATSVEAYNPFQSKKAKPDDLIERKERKKKQINNSEEDYHISQFIKNASQEDIDEIKKESKFYDDLVRTGNEFYLPQSMTDKALALFYASKNKKEIIFK